MILSTTLGDIFSSNSITHSIIDSNTELHEVTSPIFKVSRIIKSNFSTSESTNSSNFLVTGTYQSSSSGNSLSSAQSDNLFSKQTGLSQETRGMEITSITVTSCSNDVCTLVPITAGVIQLTEDFSVYTSYCPFITRDEITATTSYNEKKTNSLMTLLRDILRILMLVKLNQLIYLAKLLVLIFL